MDRKPLSWSRTVAMFLCMGASYLAFSVLSSSLHHQIGSLHSDFRTLAVPFSFACMAVFALTLRTMPLLPGLLAR